VVDVSARTAILAALDRVAARSEAAALPSAAARSVPDPAALFAERLEDYGVIVRRLPERDLPERLAADLADRGALRLVVPEGFPAAWLARVGATLLADDAPVDRLDAADAVVSVCALAIAETGTIALDGGPGQGRRAATLIPDLHACIVDERWLVGSVPEAVERLTDAVRGGRPITWISGPSATSDVELVRVAGVHGPRTLWVYLLGG
jgi:L-lactate dehydrogenase complex protein LldG